MYTHIVTSRVAAGPRSLLRQQLRKANSVVDSDEIAHWSRGKTVRIKAQQLSLGHQSTARVMCPSPTQTPAG